MASAAMRYYFLPLVYLLSATLASAAASPHWVVSWGASPSPQLPDPGKMQKANLEFSNGTIREIVHMSAGGKLLRIRLSNVFGNDQVSIGAAHIGRQAEASTIENGTDHTLTFSGRPGVTIPKNAIVISDPIQMDVPAGSNLAISLFLPKQALGGGIHYSAEQTSFQAEGDVTGSAQLTNPKTFKSWVFLSDVDVAGPPSAVTLAAFGDSITDGAHSSLDANHRWPDYLAARLGGRKSASEIGVANEGIGGNRVLHDAEPAVIGFGVNSLARFNRDVLAQPGIKYVIVLEGINDLGHAGTSAPISQTVSAQDLIAGLQQLAERAHENGLKIYGATLTPFEGTVFPGYYSPEKEEKREAINSWIRSGKAFDGVIDFDKAVMDPSNPKRMRAEFDSGDHLHPNDAGYRAMAASINLSLFK